MAALLARISSTELAEWMHYFTDLDAAMEAARDGKGPPKQAADGTPLTTPDGRPLNMRGTGMG